MKLDGNDRIVFEVGDRVRPRIVVKKDPDTGKPTKAPHEKATGGIRTDADKLRVLEQGLPDTVATVDEGSHQIQLQSWIDAGLVAKVVDESTGRTKKVPSRLHSFRTRYENFEWYDAVEPEEDAAPTKGAGTGKPKAA